MKIEEKFRVQASADEVWEFLTDPERVAEALPGAEISEKIDETTYKGGMSVSMGPVSASYTGTVSFELDEASRSATVHAKGKGGAGMGNAEMEMESSIEEVSDSETEVTVEADLKISGILAQMGRGMIEQVSKKMFKEFTRNVQQELEEG